MNHKALLAAGLLLTQAVAGPLALAHAGRAQTSGELTGFVVPNQVGANEPFTFAATNVLSGEVVNIKTVEGEVVATQKADRLGRVFLPAGLAAGAYLLSARNGKSSGRLEVQPPRNLPTGGSLSMSDVSGAFQASEGLSLSGQGISPNAAEMVCRFGKTEFPILAGTATEIKTGPLPPTACGSGPIEVRNNQTGAVSRLDQVVCYELSAKLAQEKIGRGQRTSLEFTFKPADFHARVDAQILSGPVQFVGGGKSASLLIENGRGRLPLAADPAGQGPFQVAYDIHEILGAGKLDGSTFLPAKGAGVGGEKAEPQGNEKRKRCPLTKHIRDEADGWDSSEKKVPDPANPGKQKTIYIISRKVSCNIHKSCTRDEGHGGPCAFTGKNRCKDHDTIETREFESERERDDAKKDTSIPDKIKYP